MEKIDLLRWNPYPVRYVSISSTHPAALPPRVTRWYELELVQEGSGSITSGTNAIAASAGALLLRPPGTPVQSTPPFRSSLIVFDLFYTEGKQSLYEELNFLDSTGESSAELTAGCLRIRRSDPIWDWFESFSDAYLSSLGSRWLTMKTLLLQMLEFLLLRRLDGETKSRSLALHTDQVMALQNHIRSHLGEPFSLRQAAVMCGLSEGFLCRTFRKINGLSLVEYVNQTKIGYAKRLLCETNLPVKDIAVSAGFQTETYFYTLFRRIEGVTPSCFRDMHRYPQCVSEK